MSLPGSVRSHAGLLAMPPRASLFYVRALRLAHRTGDAWTLRSATRPTSVARVLRAARGRRRVVEVGTGPGWTTAALALADAERRVVSFDPLVRPERERYLGLLDAASRSRIELVEAPGESGLGGRPPDVDFVFLDGSHGRDDTMRAFEAWSIVASPGAAIAFHDFRNPEYPGVEQAVAALGLDGRTVGDLFLWEKP
jgi:SAM-dependent methyltransferase